MTSLYIATAALSHVLVLYYLYRKGSNIREQFTLILIYLAGGYHVWIKLAEQTEVLWWMCVLLCLYQWAWCFLLLYVNKKINQQLNG